MLLGCALGATGGWAQTEIKLWSKSISGNQNDFGYALAWDRAGHVILAGASESSLGATSLGLPDVVVGKFDASGNQLWLRQRGTSDHDYALGVATDPAGNIVVCGITGGNLDGNSNAGKWDWFVMKFSPTGEWLWARQEGTSLDDEAHGVATDTNGNVYVTGFVHGALHGQTQVGVQDVFVTKYSPTGTRLWTVQFGSTEGDSGEALAVDTAGNVYVAGFCEGSIEGLPWQGNGDNFLAKYNANGQRQWLRQWGTASADTCYAVATDASGNVYVAGYSIGSLYGSASGGRDIILAKYDANGNLLWGRQLGTSERDQAWAVATDSAGNVFLAGETSSSLLGNPHAGDVDMFALKYNSSGTLLWSHQMGTPALDYGAGLTVDTSGNVYVTGRTYGSFDGHPNQGLADMFLVKYGASNTPPPPPTTKPATGLATSGFTANWYPASTATGYRLDVSTNSAFNTFLSGYQDLPVGNVTNRPVSGLASGTTYYYRVRATNAHGISGYSPTMSARTVWPICAPATLLNGSFEGPDIGGVGTNWVAYQRPPNPTTVWSIQTSGPPPGGGTRYQQIANTSSPGGAGVRQTLTGCMPGATYVVSGWMRGNSAWTTCRVKVSPTASTDWATAIDLDPPQFVSTNAWTPFSGTVVATGTNMTLWLDGQTHGSGLNRVSCFDAITVTCLVTSGPPTITVHPFSQIVFPGANASFSIVAVGVEPLGYRWQKNGSFLSDGGHYSGVLTPTLSITGADSNDAGTYRCVVTNAYGSATSSPATLTLVTNLPCLQVQNADFEAGFTLAGGGYIANGWIEWEADAGVVTGYDETTLVYSGAHAQRIRVSGGTNGSADGVYQRVPTVPGQPFSVSAWIYAGDNLSFCSLGVDPTGGTNAQSGVNWSSPHNAPSWTQKTVTGQAAADFITVYLRVASTDNVRRNGYFDALQPALGAGETRLSAHRLGDWLELSWPECPLARLEYATNLTGPVFWQTLANLPSISDGRRSVALPLGPGTAFFRLVAE